MKIININGEEVIIDKLGTPIVKLTAIPSKKPKRLPGALKGQIKVSDDFDDPLPDNILNKFEEK